MSRRLQSVRLTIGCLVAALLLVSSADARAQQSLFNVPSGEITPAGHVFIQEQASLERGYGESNLTADVGVVDGVLEAGVNVFHVGLYRANDIARGTPGLFGNLQLCLRRSTLLKLLAGTQQGVVHRAGDWNEAYHYAAQGYVVLRIGREDHPAGYWILGLYAGNRAYLGPGSWGGGMVGYEVPVVGNRLMLMGDVILGTNSASVAVLGLQSMLDRNSHVQLAAGAQLPMPGTRNAYGCVLELTVRINP